MRRPAIEPRKRPLSGADALPLAEVNTEGRITANAPKTWRGRRTWHAQRLLVREPGGLTVDRLATAVGPHRGDEEPSPMMHDREKSDAAIVAAKPTDKARARIAPAAEPVEPRAAGKSGLKNKPRQIGVLGEIADMLVHIGGIDFDRLARAVRSRKRNIVEDALHHGLQAARPDILDAGIDRHRHVRDGIDRIGGEFQ